MPTLSASTLPDQDTMWQAQYDELKATALAANSALANHTATCTHPHQYLTIKADANTGNWDPNDDSYWYVIKCARCDSRWTEDQGDSVYGQYRYARTSIKWE